MNKQKCAWKRTINRRTMKQATILLVVLAAFFTGNFTARADSGNPFGFETHKHPLEYEYCKKEPGLFRGHGYECSSAPRPHPDLEEYALQFVEGIGLCSIWANGKAFQQHNTDTAHAEFEMFKGQIAKKYGPPTSKTVEAIEPVYFWSPKAGFKGLGDVKAIHLMLDIVADNLMDTADNYEIVATVHFWLVTIDTCQKKIKDKADRAF